MQLQLQLKIIFIVIRYAHCFILEIVSGKFLKNDSNNCIVDEHQSKELRCEGFEHENAIIMFNFLPASHMALHHLINIAPHRFQIEN